LRDFETVTLEESRCWGKPSTLWTVFYEFREFVIWVNQSKLGVSGTINLTDVHGRPIIWRNVLMGVTKSYDLNAMEERFIRLRGEVPGAFSVNAVPISKLSFSCRIRGRKREIQAPSVGIYSDPTVEGNGVEAMIDKFGMGESEVIKGPQLASIIIDASEIKVPDRSIFGMVGVYQQDGIRVRDLQIVGSNNLLQSNVVIEVRPVR
jgi:hypothetical protein